MISVNARRTVCIVSKESLVPDGTITNSAEHGADRVDAVLILTKSFAFRLDNRETLIAELGLNNTSTDDEILASAWVKWRERMVTQMRGAFAFSLIDKVSGKLFVARDPLGVSPLYYFTDDAIFVIGATSKQVRSVVKKNLLRNDLMLADFVAGACLEKEQTFFQGILRLLPGHWKVVTRKKQTSQQYWSLESIAMSNGGATAHKTFRKLFDEAVARCFVERKTTLLLSGGLDSSAIAGSLTSSGVSGDEFPCLSLTYHHTKEWRDHRYLKDVTRALNKESIEVESDFHDPLKDMSHWLEVMDGPYLPHGFSVSARLWRRAKSEGSMFVLSGHGGDEVVSYGLGRLNELAKLRRWLTLWKECGAIAGIYHQSRVGMFSRYLDHIPILRRVRRKLLVAAKNPSEVSYGAIDKRYLSDQLANHSLCGRYELIPVSNRLGHDDRAVHLESLMSPLQPVSLEAFAICSEASGVETRMPFYDQELVEFCFSLPSDWKLRDGFSRYILRKAMHGDLPKSVLSRKDKFDFAENFRLGLLKEPSKLLELTSPENSEIEEFVNIRLLGSIREKLLKNCDDVSLVEARFLWRVAVLASWFKICERETLEPVELKEVV